MGRWFGCAAIAFVARLGGIARTCVALALIAVPAGVVAQTTDLSSTNPIESLFKGIGGFLSNIVSPKSQRLNELVEAKKFDEAASYYATEKAYFDEDRAAHATLLKALADALNAEQVPGIRLLLGNVERLSSPVDLSGGSWQSARLAIANAERAVSKYDEIEILKDPQYRATEVTALSSATTRLKALYEANAVQAFQTFNHRSNANFFDAYPAFSYSTVVFRDGFESVLSTFAAESPAAIANFRARYSKVILDPELAKLSNLYVERVLAERSSGTVTFFDKWTAVRNASASGFKPSSVRDFTFLAVHLTPEKAVEDGPIPKIATDTSIPLKTLKETDVGSDPGASVANYLILIQALPVDAQRKITEKREEGSKVETGTRLVPNPAFAAAQAKFIQAQSEYNNTQLRNSVTPTYGLGAAIARGIGEGLMAAVVNNAREELASTPPTLREPVYQNYEFNVTRVEVTRSTRFRIWIVDRLQKSVAQHEIPSREEKTFQIAYNLREKDPDIYRHRSTYESEKAVETYEKSDFSVKVTWLADQLFSASPSFRAMQSEASIISEAATQSQSKSPVVVAIQSQASIPDDPRMESVVVVRNPKGSLGSGFYVAPNIVLTNHHVVEGSQMAEIQVRGGQVVVGRVIKSDIGLDLALVSVSEAGKPVQFSSSPLSTGVTVEAIGHPSGLSFTVTRGIVSAIRKMKNSLVRGAREMLVVQTDAAISPGNSGGPLFVGPNVVGVNSQKLVRTGVEGIGFALHFLEVQRFIQEP